MLGGRYFVAIEQIEKDLVLVEYPFIVIVAD